MNMKRIDDEKKEQIIQQEIGKMYCDEAIRFLIWLTNHVDSQQELDERFEFGCDRILEDCELKVRSQMQ